MDGKRLSRQLRQMLNEESGSNYLDSFTTYDLLNQAASQLNTALEHLESVQTITTIANQADYTLNSDFLYIHRIDGKNRKLVRYDDGASNYIIPERDDDIRWKNAPYTVVSVSIPESFSIQYDDTKDSQATGTATSTTTKVAGKSTLNDTAGDFSDVEAGDTIHNTSDGAMGVVISKTSSIELITAMFDGTNNYWTSTDDYVIQPQAKYKLTLNQPPSNGSQTVTVEYLKRPRPVYSDYDMFQFPIQYMDALVFYAVGFYKYRNQMQNEGNTWFAHADQLVRKHNKTSNKTRHKRRVIVNFKKRQRNY